MAILKMIDNEAYRVSYVFLLDTSNGIYLNLENKMSLPTCLLR